VAFGEKVPPSYLGRKVAFSIFGQSQIVGEHNLNMQELILCNAYF